MHLLISQLALASTTGLIYISPTEPVELILPKEYTIHNFQLHSDVIQEGEEWDLCLLAQLIVLIK